MRILVLNPSTVCHNRCAACAMRKVYGNKTLPFHKIDELLKEILRFPECLRFDEVLIGGGEPLLYPRLGEILSMLEAGGIPAVVFTSGCSDMGRLKVLAENSPQRITVSLDSADSTVHDRVRGRRGAFLDGVRTLRFLRDELPASELSTMTVVTRETIKGLRSLVDFLISERVERASLQLVMDVGEVSMRGLRPLQSELEKLYLEDLPHLKEAALNAGLSLRMIPDFAYSLHHAPDEGETDFHARFVDRVSLWSKGEYNVSVLQRTGSKCPLKGHVTVNPNGSVFPCSQAALYNPKWAVGNLFNRPLRTVLDSVEKFSADVSKSAPCRRCAAMSNMDGETRTATGLISRRTPGPAEAVSCVVPRSNMARYSPSSLLADGPADLILTRSDQTGRRSDCIGNNHISPSARFTLLTENHLFTAFGAYLPPSLPGLGSGLLVGSLKQQGIPFELVDMYPLYIESACNRETWSRFAEQVSAGLSRACSTPTLEEIAARGGADALLSYFQGLKQGLGDLRLIVSRDRLVLTARLLKEYFAWTRNEIISGRGGALPFIRCLLGKIRTGWVGVTVTDPREPVTGQVVSSLIEAGRSLLIGGQATFYLESEPVRATFAKLSSSGFMVRGYGEGVLPELVKRLALDNNPGELPQVVSMDGLSSGNPELSTCGRPSHFVRPDFSFHELSGYLAPLPLLPVGITRGCYWKRCAFCRQAVKRRETVSVPLASVIDSMIHHRETLGVRHFSINDESLHPEIALELARRIRKEPVLEGVRFAAAARPEKGFSKEVLTELADAGLSTVYWGVESGHPDVLKRMQKGTHPETIAVVLENAARAGISNLAFYMLGFPGERAAQAGATINFMKATRFFVDAVRVNRFVLQDGTPVFENPDLFGIKNIEPDPHGPGLYSFEDPNGVAAKELEVFLKAARSPGLVSGRLLPLAGGGDGEELLPLYFLQRCLEVERVSFEELSNGTCCEKGLLSRGILTSTYQRGIGKTVLREGEVSLPVDRDDIALLKAMDGTRTMKELRREFTGSLVDALVEKMCAMELALVCKKERGS